MYVCTRNIQNRRFKTTNRDRKKATKSSRYCSVESVECVVHMAEDTVQLAFNYLSCKSIF